MSRKPMDYSRLSTERPNPRSRGLDRLSAEQIVRLMNREDQRVLDAVRRARKTIARGIDCIVQAFQEGGRLFFVGAGTSGRLGVMEAAECPPTFNTPVTLVQALMAGGPAAVFQSKEGAEDSKGEGRRAIGRLVRAGDVVIGIAASGVTPFVRAALQEAKRQGATTMLILCSRPLGDLAFVHHVVRLDVGPEVLTGSTRLKSGTACKMALNMLTTGSMARWGKVYGNWMVDLQPKSQKLVARGLRLIQQMGQVSPAVARRVFSQANGRVKAAILMAQKKISYAQAINRLEKVQGFLRKALEI